LEFACKISTGLGKLYVEERKSIAGLSETIGMHFDFLLNAKIKFLEVGREDSREKALGKFSQGRL